MNTENINQSAFAAVCQERDEALTKLSAVFQWINRNHSDGFVDSLTHLQNLERISDAHHEKVNGLERENATMRGALREAHATLLRIQKTDCPCETYKMPAATLAKLQPFIK